MNTTQKRRLENLALAAEQASPAGFSMSCYQNACGTPACVLGNYAARRDLQRTFRLPTRTDLGGYGWLTLSDGRETDYCRPEVREHFGISALESYELFGGVGCGRAATPARAAAYVRQFIRRKEREAKRAAR